MLKRTHMPDVACLALLFTLVFVACDAPRAATTSVPATSAAAPLVTATPAPVLVDLHAPDGLTAQFHQDAGVPRIILLVSPT